MQGTFPSTLETERYNFVYFNGIPNVLTKHGFTQQSLDCNEVMFPVHWDGLCLSDLNATGVISILVIGMNHTFVLLSMMF